MRSLSMASLSTASTFNAGSSSTHSATTSPPSTNANAPAANYGSSSTEDIQPNRTQSASARPPSTNASLPAANYGSSSEEEQTSVSASDNSLDASMMFGNDSSNFQSNDIEMDAANPSSANEDEQTNVSASNISAASIIDVQSNDIEMVAVNSSAANDETTTNKTAFPGHTQKKGRLSYFNRSEMDHYVLKFQPTQTASVSTVPRRRHSMSISRPPVSRMNRFSLDSIPEEISRENNPNATQSSRAVSRIENAGSSESHTEPTFPRIRWRIPDLITTSSFGSENPQVIKYRLDY